MTLEDEVGSRPLGVQFDDHVRSSWLDVVDDGMPTIALRKFVYRLCRSRFGRPNHRVIDTSKLQETLDKVDQPVGVEVSKEFLWLR